MADESPLLRQWRLLRAISARADGMTVRQMAEHLGVSLKTIRRDLEIFQSCGFPIGETVGSRGCKTWRVTSSTNAPHLHFTFDEAIALYLGRRFLEPLAGTLFWEAARRALEKIDAWLTPGAMGYIERLVPAFVRTSVGASDYSRQWALIDELTRAVEDRRITFIVYQSAQATEPTSYDIYPYGFVYHRGSLYLVGRAPRRDDAIRHWKVDRIEAVEVTPLQFQRPEGFDLREHLSGSFGIWDGQGATAVRIRFARKVARYVSEGTWHDSQRLTLLQDGSLLAEFELSGTQEIRNWVLSFGRNAVVLDPPELRQEILAELQAAQQEYLSDPPPAPAVRDHQQHKLPARSRSEENATTVERRPGVGSRRAAKPPDPRHAR